jgi:hypothetical protein
MPVKATEIRVGTILRRTDKFKSRTYRVVREPHTGWDDRQYVTCVWVESKAQSPLVTALHLDEVKLVAGRAADPMVYTRSDVERTITRACEKVGSNPDTTEGWCLGSDEEGKYTIQRIRGLEVFGSERDALIAVCRNAMSGSTKAIAALVAITLAPTLADRELIDGEMAV